MPVLIVIFTLAIVCLVAIIFSTSPRLTSQVREGLWSFSRYLMLCSLGLLGPLLIVLQLTLLIMPHYDFFLILASGLGISLLLLLSVEFVRRDYYRRQQLKKPAAPRRPASGVRRPVISGRLDREASLRARYQRALEHFNQKNYYDAILELQQLLEIEPNHADAHQVLGNAYSLTGYTDLALQEYQTAFTIRAMKVTLSE